MQIEWFVAHIPDGTTKEQIREFIRSAGTAERGCAPPVSVLVSEIRIPDDRKKLRGIAFARLDIAGGCHQAEQARRSLFGAHLNGEAVHVSVARKYEHLFEDYWRSLEGSAEGARA